MRRLVPAVAVLLFSVSLSAQSPSVSASKTGDASPKAPGETVTYEVTVTNSGAGVASGVAVVDTVDANTTFQGGSVNVSPLAFDDSYSAIEDVVLSITDPASGVLQQGTDDLDFLGDASMTLTTGTLATTQGGSVDLSADGTFDYTPPSAFTGTDTFTYTLTDGGGLTGTGEVTFTVSANLAPTWKTPSTTTFTPPTVRLATPSGAEMLNDPATVVLSLLVSEPSWTCWTRIEPLGPST